MKKNHLYILWTNENAITAEYMVMMYSENAILKNWWDKVTVIVWGATSKMVAENSDIQRLIKQCQEAGVEFSGCIACAAKLGTIEKLTELGIELIRWGEPLTDLIKKGEHILTV